MTKKEYDKFDKANANFQALTPLSFIERSAKVFPNHPAVVYGEIQYSWRELFDRTIKLASALTKFGIKRGDTVSILSANTPEMIEAHFGVPMSGAVLNTINTRLDSETIGYILNHSDAKIFIVDCELAPEAAKAVKTIKNQNIFIVDILDYQNSQAPKSIGNISYDEFIEHGNVKFPWQLPNDEWDAISLNYTSGTSGKPKGVVYHHRGSYLMSMGTITDWNLPKHPKYLYTVPLFHCNGWGHAWTMAALAGTMFCTRAIIPEQIFNSITTHKITHFGGAPIVLNMLLNSPAARDFKCRHPVEIMTAGAPPPASILQGIERLGFNVTQVYGLTETYGHTVMSTWNSDWNDLQNDKKAQLKARQGVGMVHTSGLKVVDLDSGEQVAQDGIHTGEILIRGNTIMKGYLKDLSTTETVFKNGWFHTGDIAVMHPDGYIEIKDRLKDIIISGGENISSVEIEDVLHKHESISLAAVVALPDEKWGEVPCAFIELIDGKSLSEDEIESFCREHLAGFKRPKKVIFCELPKTATGKIQKYELRVRARSAEC